MNVNKTITLIITTTPIFGKGSVIQKVITVGINCAGTIQKTVRKSILKTISVQVIKNTIIPKDVLVSIATIPAMTKNIKLIKSLSIGHVVSFARTYYRDFSIIISASLRIGKNIMKPVLYTSTITFDIQKRISKSFSIIINSSLIARRQLNKIVNIVINTSVLLGGKQISKILSVTENVIPSIIRNIHVIKTTAVSITKHVDFTAQLFSQVKKNARVIYVKLTQSSLDTIVDKDDD